MLIHSYTGAMDIVSDALIEYLKKNKEFNEEDIEQACSYMSEAIRINPMDIRLNYEYAMTLWLSGKEQETKDILQNLCEIFPKKSLFHASIGNILHAEGCKDSAVTHFAKAIELKPSILETKAWKQFEMNDSLSVRNIFEIIESDTMKIGHDPITLAKLGKLLYLSGDYDKSKEFLIEALAALPNLQDPWIYLWRIEAGRNGDKAVAEEYLKKAKLFGFDENRSLNGELIDEQLIKTPLPMDPEFYDPYYIAKFQLWYSTMWYPEVTLL